MYVVNKKYQGKKIKKSSYDPSDSFTVFRAKLRISTDPGTVPGLWCQMWPSSSRQLLDVSFNFFLSLVKSSVVSHQRYSADVETADRVSHRGDVNSHDSYFTHRQTVCSLTRLHFLSNLSHPVTFVSFLINVWWRAFYFVLCIPYVNFNCLCAEMR